MGNLNFRELIDLIKSQGYLVAHVFKSKKKKNK